MQGRAQPTSSRPSVQVALRRFLEDEVSVYLTGPCMSAFMCAGRRLE